MTTILGIETSCDETAAAVVVDGTRLLSNTVASQVELHAQYGGIFPEMASRAHIEKIYPIIQQTLQSAQVTLAEVDAIGVTKGPGLAGSLVVGVNAAKGLALGANIPLIAVNHIEGHIYSLWVDAPEQNNTIMKPDIPIQFPVVVLVVSGGHTELILMTDHGQYKRLGSTLDDAAGEAFDKVGRLLQLPYPGGPSIQAAAENGDSNAFDFPRVWLRGQDGKENYDFSYSGLKTAMLRTLEELQPGYEPDDPLEPNVPVADLAASFQAAVTDVLVTKTIDAAQRFSAVEIHVAGGVSANKNLRKTIMMVSDIPVRVPPLALCTDNAAMIAAAAYYRFNNSQWSSVSFDVKPNWPLA